jgi:CBS domain-containing protein
MKIRSVMTTEVATVPERLPLQEVAALLAERRISGVPVVDPAGAVVGVVSEGDIVRIEAGPDEPRRTLRGLRPPRRSEPRARTAADAMSSPPITARPGQTVAEAARLMTERHVNRLPVLRKDGSLVGIVTRADLVRAFVRSDEAIAREVRDDVILGVMWVDPTSLDIEVSDGEVTLGGTVPTRADADLIEYFVARVPGVLSVRSQLEWTIERPRLKASDPRVPEAPRRL